MFCFRNKSLYSTANYKSRAYNYKLTIAQLFVVFSFVFNKTMENLYQFEAPVLKQYGEYTFETKCGHLYEVRFVRKKDDIFHVTVAFGIEDQEVSDCYTTTNEGEPFKIISTVVAIINDYISKNPNLKKIDFTGIDDVTHKESETKETIRTRWYKRYQCFFSNWNLIQDCNHLTAVRV